MTLVASYMRTTLERLFAEAPKLEAIDGLPDPGQNPAIMCNVVLRGLPQALSGVLSPADDHGMLKLMTPLPGKTGEGMRFIEQFFHVSDVTLVALERELTGASKLWSPS